MVRRPSAGVAEATGVADIDPAARALATAFGAEHTIDATGVPPDEVAAAVREALLATDRIDDARESLTATLRSATRDLGPNHAVTQQLSARLSELSRTQPSRIQPSRTQHSDTRT